MKKQIFFLLVLALAPIAAVYSSGSTLYPWIADYSFTTLQAWSQPRIASGTSLPSAANAYAGDLFINLATPSAPSIWRKGASDWILISAASSGGVSSHSALAELDFASSGHTGFSSASALLAHIQTQTNPHGASPTFTAGISVGEGTVDSEVYRLATGVIAIASYGYIPPMTATPANPVDGYVWNDGNQHKLRFYNGTAWSDL